MSAIDIDRLFSKVGLTVVCCHCHRKVAVGRAVVRSEKFITVDESRCEDCSKLPDVVEFKTYDESSQFRNLDEKRNRSHGE